MTHKSRFNDWVTRAGEEFITRALSEPESVVGIEEEKLGILMDAALEVSRRDLFVDDDGSGIDLSIGVIDKAPISHRHQKNDDDEEFED